MRIETKNKVSARIDLKKNRIILTKKAVEIIGDPKYILLLVSPEDRTFAIIGSDETERRAHRIRYSKSNEIELYSKALLKTLLGLCKSWQGDCSYKVDGQFHKTKSIIAFGIDDAVLTGEITEG